MFLICVEEYFSFSELLTWFILYQGWIVSASTASVSWSCAMQTWRLWRVLPGARRKARGRVWCSGCQYPALTALLSPSRPCRTLSSVVSIESSKIIIFFIHSNFYVLHTLISLKNKLHETIKYRKINRWQQSFGSFFLASVVLKSLSFLNKKQTNFHWQAHIAHVSTIHF